MTLRSLFAYPLLARELTERAARRRTYAMRVGYGLVLYALFVFTVQQLVGQAALDPTGLGGLGFGRELLQTLVNLQCWSLLLLQPALMAGVITYEKERELFPLLMLTGMSPTKMLLEKYLAGLLPMATLLLLALPLGAITMGYGGVSPQLLAAGACVVLATWLQIGAFALLCSAWCRTTVGAMLAAYLVGACLEVVPALYYSLTERYVLWGGDLYGVVLPDWVWAHWPPEAFARILRFQESATTLPAGDGAFAWAFLLEETWWRCLPLLGSAAGFLVLARLVLMRRGSATAAISTRALEKRTARAVAQVTAGRLRGWWRHFLPARHDLPQDHPVAWRESGHSVLGRRGRFYYLTTMAAGLTLAVGVFLLGIYPKIAGPQRLHYLAVVLGAAALLVIVVRSVAAVLGEHGKQTLDILLTTPLGAAEILTEKARALSRYWVFFGLLLSIVFALQGWSEYQYVRANMFWRELGQFWFTSALALAIYPPLLIWGSLLIALWLRRRARATMVALIFFALWFLGPLLLLAYTQPNWRDTPGSLWLSLFSPLGILDANEHGRLAYFSLVKLRAGRMMTAHGEPWAPVAYNFIAYALLAWLARWTCLRFADRFLRK